MISKYDWFQSGSPSQSGSAANNQDRISSNYFDNYYGVQTANPVDYQISDVPPFLNNNAAWRHEEQMRQDRLQFLDDQIRKDQDRIRLSNISEQEKSDQVQRLAEQKKEQSRKIEAERDDQSKRLATQHQAEQSNRNQSIALSKTDLTQKEKDDQQHRADALRAEQVRQEQQAKTAELEKQKSQSKNVEVEKERQIKETKELQLESQKAKAAELEKAKQKADAEQHRVTQQKALTGEQQSHKGTKERAMDSPPSSASSRTPGSTVSVPSVVSKSSDAKSEGSLSKSIVKQDETLRQSSPNTSDSATKTKYTAGQTSPSVADDRVGSGPSKESSRDLPLQSNSKSLQATEKQNTKELPLKVDTNASAVQKMETSLVSSATKKARK